MSQPEASDSFLPDFQTRFEALEKKLHERLLDTEHGLKKCHQLIAHARGHSFDEIVAIVDSWMMTSAIVLMLDKPLSEAQGPSSAADILQIQMSYPYEGPLSAFSAFQLAIAYWLEAAKSFRMEDFTRSLPAVIASAHYLGMACAPPSASEHSRETMTVLHQEDTRLHRPEAVRLIEAVTQRGGAKSVSVMITEIGWQFEVFNNTVDHHWHSTNPQATLEDWCNGKGGAPEVRKAWLAAKAAWKSIRPKTLPIEEKDSSNGQLLSSS
jgi:hypothetical protein